MVPQNSTREELFECAAQNNWSLLHGGAIDFGGSIYVFPAPSCSGKTTLLWCISQLGYRASDEYILVKEENNALVFKISGMAFSLTEYTRSLSQDDSRDHSGSQESVSERPGSGKWDVFPAKRLFHCGDVQGVVFIEPVKDGHVPLREMIRPVSESEGGVLLLKSIVRFLHSEKEVHVQRRRLAWECMNTIIDTIPLYKVRVPWGISPREVAVSVSNYFCQL